MLKGKESTNKKFSKQVNKWQINLPAWYQCQYSFFHRINTPEPMVNSSKLAAIKSRIYTDGGA